MRAAIRSISCSDIEDLSSWYPEDPDCFGLSLTVLMGPEGSRGSEAFEFMVSTPEWLRQEHGSEAVIFGRHRLIVFEYDFQRIRGKIESIIDFATGDSWQEVAEKISRYGDWEFEDYTQS